MKFQLELLLVASLCAYACAMPKSCAGHDWFEYKEKYNKTYKSADEDLKHFETFCDNIDMIKNQNHEFNRGEVTYKLKVDHFTDLNSEEVNNLLKGRHSKGKLPVRPQA